MMISAMSDKLNRPAKNPSLSCFLINVYIDAWVLVTVVLLNHWMLHWFIIPTFFCGILIGKDAIGWIQGDYDLFDPKGILGVVGWHFFFLAPLLFIFWDVGMKYVVNPPDWRPWVGYLSCLNIIALFLYQGFHEIGYKTRLVVQKVFWSVNGKSAILWYFIFIILAISAQAYYFFHLGGIGGIVDLTSSQKQTGVSYINGMGIYQIIGGAIPILIIIMLSLLKSPENIRLSSKLTIPILLFILGLIQFITSGLRGSRSSTVWSLFWIAGVIHYFWRPLSRRFTLMTLLLLLSFMYLYGFYKGNSRINGLEALLLLSEGSTFSELEDQTGRSFEEMIVADMARVDTQSFLLYRLTVSTDYRFRWGSTYLSSISSFFPSWIWADRPLEPEKVVAGTELFYGRDSYIPGDKFQNSQKVYGLGGEALLNFGFLAFPIPFSLLGFLIGRYRRSMLIWQLGDFRWFFAPLLTLSFVIFLIGDFYNLLGFLVSKGLIPVTILFITLIMFGSKEKTGD